MHAESIKLLLNIQFWYKLNIGEVQIGHSIWVDVSGEQKGEENLAQNLRETRALLIKTNASRILGFLYYINSCLFAARSMRETWRFFTRARSTYN